MTSFCGSETIPAIAGLEGYYNANAGEELIAATATLSENYKEVYFTNSYRDWGREALPDNVKVIEVV